MLRPRRGLAWHCSTARIGPLPHLTPEGHHHVSCLQMDGIASQPKTTHSQKYIHLYLEIPPICQAGMAIMDGHADADRLPIRKMRRYIALYPTYISDIRIDAHRQKYLQGHP